MTESPGMFRRPTDPPEPLMPLRTSEHVVRLHTEWARMHAGPTETGASGSRLRDRVRALASRLGGGADHRFLGDVVRALDAIATRCDELSERVAGLEVTTDDLARVLGEELTQLRAAVERIGPRPEHPPSSTQ